VEAGTLERTFLLVVDHCRHTQSNTATIRYSC